MASAAPPETLYFAYGSNLSPTQMAARCPASRLLGVARLRNYRWMINERGYANVGHVARLRGHGPGWPRTEAVNRVESGPGAPREPEESTAPVRSEPDDGAAHADADAAAESEATVYGLLYALPPADEARLDVAEGVPQCYGKEWLAVDFWPLDADAPLAPAEHARAKVAALGAIPDPYLVRSSGSAQSTESSEGSGAAEAPRGRAFVHPSPPPPSTRSALVYVDRVRLTTSPIMPEYIARIWRAVFESQQRGIPPDWLQAVIVPALEGPVRA